VGNPEWPDRDISDGEGFVVGERPDWSPRGGAGQYFLSEPVEVFLVEMDRDVVAGATCCSVVVYVVAVQVGHKDGVQVVPSASRVRKRRRQPALRLETGVDQKDGSGVCDESKVSGRAASEGRDVEMQRFMIPPGGWTRALVTGNPVIIAEGRKKA